MSAQAESQPIAGLDVRHIHLVEMKPGVYHSKFDLLKELPVDPSQIIRDFPNEGSSYKFHGAFNSKEVENLRKNAKVLSVSGFDVFLSFRGESASGSDVIIGDMIRRRLKGECQDGTGFSPSNCNKKLIGARFSSQGDVIKQVVPSNSSDHLQLLVDQSRAWARARAKPRPSARARARPRPSARELAKQIKQP